MMKGRMIPWMWRVLLSFSGMGLMACSGAESNDTEVTRSFAAPLVTKVLVDGATPAYYNAALGTALDGTQPQFPLANVAAGDPTINPAAEPTLSAVSSRLGGWLSSNPLPLNSYWSGPQVVPASWPVNTETAIVYALDAGATGMQDVVARFGVDNGIFVWLDGNYRFGALAGGHASEWEYSVSLGDLSPGMHFLQILREDHGGATGYLVQVTGVVKETLSCDNNSGHFTPTGATAALHQRHSATALGDGRVLVVGGYTRSAEVYTPASGNWTTTGTPRTTHRLHTATLLADGRVLVAGGDGASASASAEVYDPASGTWAATGNLLTYRREHAAVRLKDGRVLVMGGRNKAGTVLASVEVYDPASGSWGATGSMAHARRALTATLLQDGRVLVVGGLLDGSDECRGSNCLASAEVYNPASGTWAATGTMTHARAFHAATLLVDGTVLVAGGGMDGQQSTSAEVYTPASGTWMATSHMLSPRRRHSLTLLPGGLVLAVGGYDATTGIQASAELYTPSSGTWCATGTMGQGRYEHTSTLLPDGRVLITAGFSNSSQYSAEVYDLGH